MNKKGLGQASELAKKVTEAAKMNVDLEEVYTKSLELVESCNIAMVGSTSTEGYPNIKAMVKADAEGLKTIWFSTNTSSKRIAQFKADPKACIYFVDQEQFKGLMLVGEMEVLTDIDSKKHLWVDGCEVYYPLGVEDPDYSVLRFTAKKGNYYHGLKNINFDI